MPEWNPDPKVIKYLEAKVAEDPDQRIAVGNRMLTWKRRLKEVRHKTAFGFSYHQALRQSLPGTS